MGGGRAETKVRKFIGQQVSGPGAQGCEAKGVGRRSRPDTAPKAPRILQSGHREVIFAVRFQVGQLLTDPAEKPWSP